MDVVTGLGECHTSSLEPEQTFSFAPRKKQRTLAKMVQVPVEEKELAVEGGEEEDRHEELNLGRESTMDNQR